MAIVLCTTIDSTTSFHPLYTYFRTEVVLVFCMHNQREIFLDLAIKIRSL